MKSETLLDRIESRQDGVLDNAFIRGTCFTVATVLKLMAKGTTTAEILKTYNQLSEDDIRACILFAAVPSSVSSLST